MSLEKYKKEDREDLQFGATNAAQNAASMPFDDLIFWLGLGILFSRRYALKATHDELTAWPPSDGIELPQEEENALLRCGWHKTNEDENPCAWVSFYAGG